MVEVGSGWGWRCEGPLETRSLQTLVLSSLAEKPLVEAKMFVLLT